MYKGWAYSALALRPIVVYCAFPFLILSTLLWGFQNMVTDLTVYLTILSLDQTMNCQMIELDWKECEKKKNLWPNLRYYPSNFLGWTEKDHKENCQDRQCPYWDSNWAPPKQKAKALSIQPICWVHSFFFMFHLYTRYFSNIWWKMNTTKTIFKFYTDFIVMFP
jgi:hypothetical protein